MPGDLPPPESPHDTRPKVRRFRPAFASLRPARVPDQRGSGGEQRHRDVIDWAGSGLGRGHKPCCPGVAKQVQGQGRGPGAGPCLSRTRSGSPQGSGSMAPALCKDAAQFTRPGGLPFFNGPLSRVIVQLQGRARVSA